MDSWILFAVVFGLVALVALGEWVSRSSYKRGLKRGQIQGYHRGLRMALGKEGMGRNDHA
jgi:hypothetical protein